MPASIMPIIFVFLWASAFISAKAIMADGTAFASLALRFGVVGIGFLIATWLFARAKKMTSLQIIHAAITGIFLHGFYLGGVFWALSHGMPATISALIISLQPVFTALLAGPFLGERITIRQWGGIALGFTGTIIVIGFDFGNSIPLTGVIVCFLALAAAIAGTLYQKRFGQDLPLLPANMIQAFAAVALHLALLALFEVPAITFTNQFLLGMAWQVFAVSFGAYVMLLILLARGTANQTSSLLFLIAPVAALQGYVVLGEVVTSIDIIGLALASCGVYIATRQSPSPQS